jgi:hypothetical protein
MVILGVGVGAGLGFGVTVVGMAGGLGSGAADEGAWSFASRRFRIWSFSMARPMMRCRYLLSLTLGVGSDRLFAVRVGHGDESAGDG